MDSASLGRVITTAFSDAGFKRVGSGFYFETPELLWIVRPEKDRYSPRRHIRLGIFLKELDPNAAHPDENECHIMLDYADLSDEVPAVAAKSRFSDRRSYFTMILDPTHELVDDDERTRALEFMAREVVARARNFSNTEALSRFVSDTPSLLIDKRVRPLLSR